MKTFLLPAAVAAVACNLMLSSPVRAAEEPMEMGANPTAICQGALPNFEGAIRKRPLAVQNEGSSPSFVTCSFVTGYNPDAMYQISYFGAHLINRAAVARTVTCTGVSGYDTGEDNVYVSKQVTIPASQQLSIFFTPDDNTGAGYYPLASMSCNIPPGVGINDTYVGYLVDDN